MHISNLPLVEAPEKTKLAEQKSCMLQQRLNNGSAPMEGNADMVHF
jgi:hypothetical protein